MNGDETMQSQDREMAMLGANTPKKTSEGGSGGGGSGTTSTPGVNTATTDRLSQMEEFSERESVEFENNTMGHDENRYSTNRVSGRVPPNADFVRCVSGTDATTFGDLTNRVLGKTNDNSNQKLRGEEPPLPFDTDSDDKNNNDNHNKGSPKMSHDASSSVSNHGGKKAGDRKTNKCMRFGTLPPTVDEDKNNGNNGNNTTSRINNNNTNDKNDDGTIQRNTQNNKSCRNNSNNNDNNDLYSKDENAPLLSRGFAEHGHDNNDGGCKKGGYCSRARGATNIKCVCGDTLDQIVAFKAYPSVTYVLCDVCGSFCDPHSLIYHCPNKGALAHPHGYDMCSRCAAAQSISFTQNNGKQENDKPLPSELLQPQQQAQQQQVVPVIEEPPKVVNKEIEHITIVKGSNESMGIEMDDLYDDVPQSFVAVDEKQQQQEQKQEKPKEEQDVAKQVKKDAVEPPKEENSPSFVLDDLFGGNDNNDNNNDDVNEDNDEIVLMDENEDDDDDNMGESDKSNNDVSPLVAPSQDEMSVDHENNTHKKNVEVGKKETQYEMKTSDHETQIETDTVESDTIFDDSCFTTTNDRKKEEKMNGYYHNNNSKAKSHNDKKFQTEHNNTRKSQVLDIHIENEEDIKVNNDWYLSSATLTRKNIGHTCILFEHVQEMKADPSLPNIPLEYVIYVTYLSTAR